MPYKDVYKSVKELINAIFYETDINNKYSDVALGYAEKQALRENVKLYSKIC